jgi:hypothetical protein
VSSISTEISLRRNYSVWLTSGHASFAFVEYESRRDADDAYHEMHNKRIGRDDLLKIEVSGPVPIFYLLFRLALNDSLLLIDR